MKSFEPDVIMFTTLINGLCKKGQVNETHNLLQEMLVKGCSLDATTYNILIKAALNNDEELVAIVLLREMRESGFPMDSLTVELLLDDRLDSNFLKLIQKLL